MLEMTRLKDNLTRYLTRRFPNRVFVETYRDLRLAYIVFETPSHYEVWKKQEAPDHRIVDSLPSLAYGKTLIVDDQYVKKHHTGLVNCVAMDCRYI